jgi:hypothetical protein
MWRVAPQYCVVVIWFIADPIYGLPMEEFLL